MEDELRDLTSESDAENSDVRPDGVKKVKLKSSG